MINALPFIGWIISAGLAISMAIPFWVLWHSCGIGRKFFYFLPALYIDIGFWNTVGLFIVISILKSVLIPVSVNAGSGK